MPTLSGNGPMETLDNPTNATVAESPEGGPSRTGVVFTAGVGSPLGQPRLVKAPASAHLLTPTQVETRGPPDFALINTSLSID